MGESVEMRITIEISDSELRELIHWSSYGVGKAINGSYKHRIEKTINKYKKLSHYSGKVHKFGDLVI